METQLALRIVQQIADEGAIKEADIGDDGFKRIRFNQQQDALATVKQIGEAHD